MVNVQDCEFIPLLQAGRHKETTTRPHEYQSSSDKVTRNKRRHKIIALEEEAGTTQIIQRWHLNYLVVREEDNKKIHWMDDGFLVLLLCAVLFVVLKLKLFE